MLDSVINQTYNYLEIILVDDGSDDGSADICDMYEQMDKRIKVIHQQNGGLVSARKEGLKHATGEYVSYIDSDDRIERDAYKELSLHIKNYSPDFIECFFYKDYDGVTSVRKVSLEEGYYTKEKIVNSINTLLNVDPPFVYAIHSSLCSRLIKRTFLIEYQLEKTLKGKTVALVAPGKSSEKEKEKIIKATKDAVCISVNFDYACSDFIFLSNLRSYRELDETKYRKCIVTSNITSDKVYLRAENRNLLNNIDAVRDNAGLMAIKFLMDYGVERIYLAGFDGYTHDAQENYGDSQMTLITKNAVLDAMNDGMNKILALYSEKINLVFLTEKKHIGV